MNRREALTLAAIALAVVAYIEHCAGSQPTSPNAAKIAKTDDLLRTARAKLDTLLTQSAVERQASSDAQRALAAREARSRARADAEKRKADSLAVLAAASGSTSDQWRTAYESRTEEAGHLRTELAAVNARADSLAADTLRLSRDLDATVTYAQAVERLNRDVQDELANATECRIAGKVPCPSRAQVGITGLLLGVILMRR